VYSVLSPEGFASILWKDASRAAEAASVMKLTAYDLLGFGMADAIVREPPGGSADKTEMARALRPVLRRSLSELRALGSGELARRRRARYREF
jgi:acetyl-CoA carboxylase carboxyl transferase subunit alpha